MKKTVQKENKVIGAPAPGPVAQPLQAKEKLIQKGSKHESEMDKLYDKLYELSKEYILTKYDGDYIFQNNEGMFTFSDYILGNVDDENASNIVLSCMIRQKIKVATELVIPEVPVKGMWNVVNNITSAVSHVKEYTTSVQDILAQVEGEVDDWDRIIYRKGNAISTSKIVGFSIQPGKLSPTWIPILQEMALAPANENESIKAYQLIFGHMFYNQSEFKTMSLKEAELIRAGALLETLCTSPQGTMKYCMTIKHVANSLDSHVQAFIKPKKVDKDRKLIAQPKFSKGKNPYVSYEKKGKMNSERLDAILAKKREGRQQTIKSKYKGLNDYERQQINSLFSETSRCKMPEGLKIHSFRLNGIPMSPDARRTAIRVNIPTILKSQGAYFTYTKVKGFGEKIISPSMTPAMFEDKEIVKPYVDGYQLAKQIREYAKQKGEKTYSYTFVPNGVGQLDAAEEYYGSLETPDVVNKIRERKNKQQKKEKADEIKEIKKKSEDSEEEKSSSEDDKN